MDDDGMGMDPRRCNRICDRRQCRRMEKEVVSSRVGHLVGDQHRFIDSGCDRWDAAPRLERSLHTIGMGVGRVADRFSVSTGVQRSRHRGKKELPHGMECTDGNGDSCFF